MDLNRFILVGGPRRGKSTFARLLRLTDVPTYCTDPRSLCKEPEDGVTYLPEEFKDKWSKGSEFVAQQWFTMPGKWCVDGVGTARALRKWKLIHQEVGQPADRIIVFNSAKCPTSQGQETMAKAVETIWEEVKERFAQITESSKLV